MEPFRTFTSRAVVLPRRDVDTDQIIPARFLKGTTREGLGKWLFSGWRYDATGAPVAEFPLNDPRAEGACILVAGANFGCGSSREHAPWALVDHGFRAVISASIADIFRNNAVKNGLVPAVVDEQAHRALLANPFTEVTVDLQAQEVRAPGMRARFSIDPFARRCLLDGIDELGFLLARSAAITAHERARRREEEP
ncbi:MAG: 3-isopropylmalate dehydratase small subunit [Myxococcaceae bacterium]|nr:MAG: 3-isopropylmalate dehydratase small subunit [Myxococcaceae bacterium]